MLFSSPRDTQASSRRSVPLTEALISWATSAASSSGLRRSTSNKPTLDAVKSAWKTFGDKGKELNFLKEKSKEKKKGLY